MGIYYLSPTSGSIGSASYSVLANMPTLTRCRAKTPESDALRASPNPHKLKKAAKKVKESKAKTSEAKDLKTPSPRPILKEPQDTLG